MKPVLDTHLDSHTFREYYFLKEELVRFCRENGLSPYGSKGILTERIAKFLDTGEIINNSCTRPHLCNSNAVIEINSKIGSPFVCSEKHRAFFKQHIGKKFTFNVRFQRWLRNNPQKTFGDAIAAYREIAKTRKQTDTEIESQFEYNAYIRDFFSDNVGKRLADAIKCWNFKKSFAGHNRYEKSDLSALSDQ